MVIEQVINTLNSELKSGLSNLLSEENYRYILDNSALAITVIDSNENIVVWNKCAETLLGWKPDELLLKPVADLYPPDEWSKIREASIRQKSVNRQIETRIVTKNGQIIEVDLYRGPEESRRKCPWFCRYYSRYIRTKKGRKRPPGEYRTLQGYGRNRRIRYIPY
jgi:PAS domain S-box-containing protein